MTEDFLNRMYQLLDHDPESDDVTQFIYTFRNDPELVQTWQDFLVEQYLAGITNEAWRNYIHHIPQLERQIEFQTQIQQGIRTIGERITRAEIREILPKRNGDGIKKIGRGPRFIIFAASIAAVALLCIGVMINKFWVDNGIVTGEGGVPIVMIEPIDAETIPEENLADRILQRIPAKLTAATGICPVTYYAVGHATHRAKVNETPQEIVNANYTMQSKVRREGGGYVVNASLVDLADNRPLWKESFAVEDNPKAFDDFQDKISLKIVNSLNLKLSSDARIRMEKDISDNAQAVRLFLDGEKQWAERRDSSLLGAVDLFSMALVEDSTSSIIRGYLALAYATYEENYGDDKYWQVAVREAERTLLSDTLNPEALLVLGDYAETKLKDYSRAEEYHQRALQVQPSDAKIHQALAELYLRTGNIDEGVSHIRLARLIEPEHRVVRWLETKYLTATGRLDIAKEAAQDLLEMYPTYPNIQNFFWQYHLSRNDYEMALDTIPRSRSDAAQNYMRAFVYLEQNNDIALDSIYLKLPEVNQPSIVLLRYVKDNEWEAARALMQQLISEKRFELVALSQSSDFGIFNKMKQDAKIRRILLEAGIKVNIIPKEIPPEI